MRVAALLALLASPALPQDDLPPVSYARDVRPLLMARCAGCHQAAKPEGDVALTSHADLLLGLDGFPLVVPGRPDDSLLVQVVEPWKENPPEMPAEGSPLTEHEVGLLRRWIAAGAPDDSGEADEAVPTAESPPEYATPPVISGVAFSPDGHLLAVTGRHEVLLHHLSCGEAVETELATRLVGMSPRVDAIAFSPDGARLAAVGGAPARHGEVQVWHVESGELELSVPVTYDVLRGVSWSPDGTRIAFGGADSSMRALDVATGEEVLFNAAHDDWVLGTDWSTDGSHLLSVSRDRSLKLTKVETQQFIDNVTSITPGALKGGLMSVVRHPTEDQVLVGGADGAPKVFRVYREKKRVIGDDYNLIREFPAIDGRVYDVAWSPDGGHVYAVASTEGGGEVRAWSAADGAEQWRHEAPTPLFTLHVHPGGGRLAVAGFDGEVRLLSAETGALDHAFLPVPLADEASAVEASYAAVAAPEFGPREALEEAPAGLVSVEVTPSLVALDRPESSVQVLLTGVLADGTRVDVTRAARVRAETDHAVISPRGLVRPGAEGEGALHLAVGELEVDVPVVVTGQAEPSHPGFRRDVMPILSAMGCNTGACHGSAGGQNGFYLSLRGYDPTADHRALTDDLATRRVDLSMPGASLFLAKPSAAVPHEGGQLLVEGSAELDALRRWVAAGARDDAAAATVESISLLPRTPTLADAGARQQLRVLASYSDGSVRDVTALSFVETSDTEVTSVDEGGLVTALRRGEASLFARYEGRYASLRVVVMGDREGFAWTDPPSNGWIDDLVHQKQRDVKVLPSDDCTDAEFLRRATLDLTGRIPSPEEVRTFQLDTRDPRVKREELVDRLIGAPAYVEHWSNRWADLLQVNKFELGDADAERLRDWVRAQVASNRPYDEFVAEVLTGSGSAAEEPTSAWYRAQGAPDLAMESATQLFLGVRFNCNKCHDHPFEKWTQDQHWELAAYFGQTVIDEGARTVADAPDGELVVPDSGEVAAPKFPYVHAGSVPNDAPRREQLAAWVTASENPYFARSYVNRVWSYLMGVGLIEPVDDIRAGNPPSNPALLDRLTSEFVAHDFDVRWLLREIVNSRAYQRSVDEHEWNAGDHLNYAKAIPRRLPAEVLYDAVHAAAGVRGRLERQRPGTRAAEIPGGGVDSPDRFLALFGRPPRLSPCECERSNNVTLGQALNLVNGPTVGEVLRDPTSAVSELAGLTADATEIVDELFVRFLSRPATPTEVGEFTTTLDPMLRENALALPPDRHADLERRLAEWEAGLLPLAEWTTLAVTDGSRAVNGSTLERQPDGSILVTGDNPDQETLVLVAVTSAPRVTGVRLEVLPNPDLPTGGPGRGDNGNFVLNELTATAVPLLDPANPKPLTFSNVTADFSQQSWAVAGLVDGNPASGWAVSPQFGRAHEAVLELQEDLALEGDWLLVFRLEQTYGSKHTIGKLRLSLTESERPVRYHGLPEPVLTALRVAPDARTEAQRQALYAHWLATQPALQDEIRLGATQDLAWALVNSPAFLFNR